MQHQDSHAEVHQLYSRILGDPQTNVDKAIATFLQEFETKRTLLIDKNDTMIPMLQEAPSHLRESKGRLEAGLGSTNWKSKTTLARLETLQQSVAASSQENVKPMNATQMAKEVFQKDIAEAKEAFDQEMALRHADVVKQYVGAFVQQIDHY
ncbi:hypothetical protein EDD11_010459 [Mortierella claussenii]|nr:hypothetical protein EDD11_010459 [Mortierella claussenii]